MATTKYGSYMDTSGASNFIRPYISYTITTSTTAVTCAWTAGCNVKTNYHTSAKITLKSTATGQTSKSETVDNKNWGGGNHKMLEGSYSWARGTSASTSTITAKMSTNVDSSSVSISISVPALPTVTVTYNSLGGTAVNSTTLYYGRAGKVSNTAPTRDNYTFMGWSATEGGTTVNYSPGASITRTSDIELYAVWKSAYVAPSIIGNAIMYRVANDADNRSPALLNEGTRAYFEFSTTKGNNILNYNTSPHKIIIDGSEATVSSSLDLESGLDSSGNEIKTYYGYVGSTNGGTFNQNTSYNIEIIVTLTDTNNERHTISIGSFLSAEVYMMDLSADGKRVAFGQLASDAGAGETRTDFAVEIKGDLELDGSIHAGSNLNVDGNIAAASVYLTGDVKDSSTSAVKYQTPLTVSSNISLTSHITRTAGTSVANLNGTYSKWGRIVQLHFMVYYSTSVASGGDIFTGTLTTANLRPIMSSATGVGYYGARSIVMRLQSNGAIVIRNASSSSVKLDDSPVYISLTYISAS